ncbi:MAG: glycosyltransferase [Planctomycetota bacterium]|nr:glycosyltransferase [Planctomycetota bacterium]
MLFALICCSVLMLVSVLIWLAVVFHPARAWDFQPVAEDVPAPPPPEAWPPVCILVPARNESETLPRTLPALLGQEYAGPLRVVLVDDRSTDGTAEVARRLGREAGAEGRLSVLEGQPLPDGWVGKVWALEQGRRHAAGLGAKYLLLTDADILHARHSLKRLVAESEAAELALNSRMALLRCQSGAERLLIPAFVFFFNLLYPMRWVNDPRHALAASAGGCVLLNAEALAAAGGLETIRGAIIDDVSLARAVKAPGRPLRLALSRNDVVSLRAYDDLDSVWSMVRRTAFTELGYSWLKLLGCIGMLAILFVLPRWRWPAARCWRSRWPAEYGTPSISPGRSGSRRRAWSRGD